MRRQAVQRQAVETEAGAGKVLCGDGDASARLAAQNLLVGGARLDQIDSGEGGAFVDRRDLRLQLVEGGIEGIARALIEPFLVGSNRQVFHLDHEPVSRARWRFRAVSCCSGSSRRFPEDLPASQGAPQGSLVCRRWRWPGPRPSRTKSPRSVPENSGGDQRRDLRPGEPEGRLGDRAMVARRRSRRLLGELILALRTVSERRSARMLWLSSRSVARARQLWSPKRTLQCRAGLLLGIAELPTVRRRFTQENRGAALHIVGVGDQPLDRGTGSGRSRCAVSVISRPAATRKDWRCVPVQTIAASPRCRYLPTTPELVATSASASPRGAGCRRACVARRS